MKTMSRHYIRLCLNCKHRQNSPPPTSNNFEQFFSATCDGCGRRHTLNHGKWISGDPRYQRAAKVRRDWRAP